ncbi:peptide ABC transporter substrate-binding protein [Janibacter corallicola]|uniref:peptide ABC transporter substrate-binding protein n=1 Tax=Janibacter corallicola TaxID=415212 RepID=UPI001FE10B41|nr:ABC transporter substrate-binding protein [Janibacter corallicola]
MAVASISAVALLATACGGSSDDGGGGEGGSGGEVVVNGCTPENPLVAGNTAETCGGNVLDTITAKLIHYDSKTAEPEMDIAKSIDTKDNQHFTVKLKKGYKFHDGTEVKAKNFVDAWNYTAYGPNAQQGSYFFEPIKGYADTQCTGDDEEDPCKGSGNKAKSKKLSGLKVVDDHTFTIETTEKVSNLPLRLGYTAFAPQPDSFFKDPEKAGQNPVAAGPYKFDSWTKNQSIKLSKFDDYSGEFGGKADKITFKIFKTQEAAYTALLGGEIDIIDQVPSNALVGDKFKSDLGDGKYLEEPNSTSQWVGMNPHVDKKLSDVNVRRAISMAIDRKTITKQIFDGAYEPSTGVVSPVVDGFKKGQCGEYCTFDPAKAKKLLKKGGGYDGKLELTYNGDGGHKEWTEAVCNQIKNNIGINCVATPTVDFATMLTKLGKNELKGMWRMGWVMDYPSIENYLTPIFSKGASSNYYQYDNPEFEKLLKQAAAADDQEEANKLYQKAERVLEKDMVAIPLWYGKAIMGWSDDVDNVKSDPFGNPVLNEVTVN